MRYCGRCFVQFDVSTSQHEPVQSTPVPLAMYTLALRNLRASLPLSALVASLYSGLNRLLGSGTHLRDSLSASMLPTPGIYFRLHIRKSMMTTRRCSHRISFSGDN